MKITRELLRKWGACYNDKRIAELVSESGLTPTEIAALDIPAEARLWVLLREEVIPARELRLLACDWAEEACEETGWNDERSLNAIAVARRFACGDATEAELDATETEARAAARAAWAAARAASRAASRAAGVLAASAAAVRASWTTTEAAAAEAWEASRAWSAAWSAACSASGESDWATSAAAAAAAEAACSARVAARVAARAARAAAERQLADVVQVLKG